MGSIRGRPKPPNKSKGLRRCPSCGKKSHRSRKAAAQSAAAVRSRSGETVDYYKCPDGNGWHIGHVPGRHGRAALKDRMRRSGISPTDAYNGRR